MSNQGNSSQEHENQCTKKFMESFHDVALRFLLIDDRIGGQEDCRLDKGGESDTIKVIKCSTDKDCSKFGCKLCTIKRLMDDGATNNGGANDGKNVLFDGIGSNNDFFYWQEKNIDCYYCPTKINDFFSDDKKSVPSSIEIEGDFTFKKDDLHVQIVGVRDVRTALLLMRKFKFDMVLCDYLLDERDDNYSGREYATQLFRFLAPENKTDSLGQIDDLSVLRTDVLGNRGPVNKFWIMPVTGFNQTFVQDLHGKQINLIDYKWNISNGADPITTPWQFLFHLNEFIELQLKSCVYRMDQLLRFLNITCEHIIELRKKKEIRFFEFQAFMGSEYANFMRRYGNRHLIQRDAVWNDADSDNKNKSLFATYVWREFYAKRKYREEIELNRLIQRFLCQASTMYNDKDGWQRLDESFAKLRKFINENLKNQFSSMKEIIKIDYVGFEKKMDDFREVMDVVASAHKPSVSSNNSKQKDAENGKGV